MANVPGGTILDYLYRTSGAAALAGQTDGELLRHVLAGPGAPAEAAFTVLLHRHGPLVYRTCRCVLRDTHDAEDAIQATFLVLARKARSLRVRGDLGPWLYEVARRVSAHARVAAARRQKHEQQAAIRAGSVSDGKINEPEIASLVHDAVGQLPQRFRATVVLCDLEGLSYRDAAGRLGLSLATVRNRLARGRQRLRTALRRAGLAPEASALTAGAAPTLPRALAVATARAAAQTATGTAVGGVPKSVLALVNGGLHAMLIAKLKTVGLSMLAGVVLIAGAYGLGAQGPAPRPKESEPPPPPFTQAPDPPAREAPAPPAPQQPPMTAQKLVAKLNQIVDVQQEIDNTPLKDVLSFLTDKYGVTFIVDVQAFDRDNANRKVEDSPVRLPKLPGVSLRTVLRHVLDQVQGDILVRNDHLSVVSRNEAIMAAFGRHPGRYNSEQRIGIPVVNVVCVGQPLERALADIAEQSGRNVVLDSRVTDRDKLVVTARLLNTLTDTAVRVLAELCNLKSVTLDNVLIVTTREHAAELQAEEAKTAEALRRELEEWKQDIRERNQQSKPNAPPPKP